MKKLICGLLLFTLLHHPTRAEEGMWIPMLIEQLNIRRMQDLGLRLSAKDIYSINHSSLKDAIVHFGGGCTAEIVSPEGLILTNHHCGLGSIQRLSSLQHDYITNGFWAASLKEELPCPGLTVTLLVRIEDVTERVLRGISEEMSLLARSQIIARNSAQIEKEAAEGTGYEAKIRPFFYGNQYYLFVSEVFKDVRLAGAPPAGIGKFGGDTDNWMWPRHTGDFSVFRIYAGKDNKAATYAPDNVPYKPKKFIPVSLKGYEKGDFTFVFGYPGSTREYLPSYGVDLIANRENPVRIDLRRKRLDVINQAMDTSRLIRIQYTGKANGIANFWKKMIGESKGIRQAGVIAEKQAGEQKFREWAGSDAGRNLRYGGLLAAFESVYKEYTPVDISSIYLTEAGQSIEVIRFAAGFRELVELSGKKETPDSVIARKVKGMDKPIRDFYRNYNREVDRRLAMILTGEMGERMDAKYLPGIFATDKLLRNKQYQAFAVELYRRSVFPDSIALQSLLSGYQKKHYQKLTGDPVFVYMKSIYDRYEKQVQPATRKFQADVDSLMLIYVAGLMEMNPGKTFYPDANSTLRVAFGKVDGFSPADAVDYRHYTTLEGVMQKEDPAVYDYRVDGRLKKLFTDREYGIYADANGEMRVAFIASNHTTGGNSGSPVLNASGELIGINFDRNWEGTMSDLRYDPSRCRNIALDIRYCLFIIDKYAGCRRLVEEMTLVK